MSSRKRIGIPSDSSEKCKTNIGTPGNNNKKCKSSIHDGSVEPKRTFTTTSKDFSKKAFKYLQDNHHIGPYAKYVCNVCLEYGTQMLSDAHDEAVEEELVNNESYLQPESENDEDDCELVPSGFKAKQLADAADMLIAALSNPSTVLDDELNGKLSQITYLLGEKVVRPSITKHCQELKGVYKETSKLENLDSKNFLNSGNLLLIRFISGITGLNLNFIQDTKVLYRFAVVIESIYHLKNCHIVLPHCFVMNLIQKHLSGSKTVAAVNGKVLPGCGDSTMREWWELQGSNVLSLPPTIDIALYYDNVGKYIVKSYRVKAERNHTPTVVTATQCIELNKPANQPMLQTTMESCYDSTFKTFTEAEIQVRMLEIRERSIEDFRYYRLKFIKEIFDYMSASTEMDSMIKTELGILQSAHLTRRCDECGKMFPARKLKCDECGGHVSSSEGNLVVYDSFSNKLPKFFNIGQKGLKNPVKISSFEPVMENPNSYESIKSIIDTLYKDVIDSNSECGRKWVFVGADGPPYCLMRRLKVRYPEKYKWLAVLSGKGHLKMNMNKGIFKFADKIFLNILGQDVLKFDSAKSYDYFIKCKDTHKSYQALEILLIGTTMELIYLYSRSVRIKPTPKGFLEWVCDVQDPTLRFVCQFILNFVLAVYIHRIGDRHNDAKCSNAGRMKFFDLFFALNHPIYREVEYNDLRERALYSLEVTALRERNNSYVGEGSSLANNHQDGDFKLEERVKMMKRLSPKGRMDKRMWQRVARGNTGSLYSLSITMMYPVILPLKMKL